MRSRNSSNFPHFSCSLEKYRLIVSWYFFRKIVAVISEFLNVPNKKKDPQPMKDPSSVKAMIPFTTAEFLKADFKQCTHILRTKEYAGESDIIYRIGTPSEHEKQMDVDIFPFIVDTCFTLKPATNVRFSLPFRFKKVITHAVPSRYRP